MAGIPTTPLAPGLGDPEGAAAQEDLRRKAEAARLADEQAKLRKVQEASAKLHSKVATTKFISGADTAARMPTTPDVKHAMGTAQGITQQGRDISRDPNAGAIATGAVPQVGTYGAPRMTAPAAVRAQDDRGGTAFDQAAGAVGLAGDSRGRQAANMQALDDLAAGRGPSVGREMFAQGAERAQGLMRAAGAEAAGQFGAAALDQQAATRAAGVAAADQIQQQSSQALRAQAAMAAGARGGGIGAAMLQGMNNQALAGQAATVQGAQAMRNANAQASDQAARATLQTGGALERANIAAGNVGADMMAQGAQQGAQEQLAAYGMRTGAVEQLRGQDLGQIGAQTDLARAGAGIDAQADAVALANAGRAFDASAANLNAGLSTNQLNAGLQTGNADRLTGVLQGNQADALGRTQLGLDTQLAGNQQFAGLSAAEAEAERQRRLANAGFRNDGRDRYGNYLTGQANIRSADKASDRAFWGQVGAATIGGVGAGVGAYLLSGGGGGAPPGGAPPGQTQAGQPIASDIRAKKNIKPAENAAMLMIKALCGGDDEDDADFRKADAYEYEYKDPKKHGRGKFTGPMAQDLPKGTTKRGKDGVISVDPGRVVMLMASALGQQQKRIDELEKG